MSSISGHSRRSIYPNFGNSFVCHIKDYRYSKHGRIQFLCRWTEGLSDTWCGQIFINHDVRSHPAISRFQQTVYGGTIDDRNYCCRAGPLISQLHRAQYLLLSTRDWESLWNLQSRIKKIEAALHAVNPSPFGHLQYLPHLNCPLASDPPEVQGPLRIRILWHQYYYRLRLNVDTVRQLALDLDLD